MFKFFKNLIKSKMMIDTCKQYSLSLVDDENNDDIPYLNSFVFFSNDDFL